MKKYYLFFIVAFLSLSGTNSVLAQMVGAAPNVEVYIQGRWLEIGCMNNAAFGTSATAIPPSYHPHLGGVGCPVSGGNLAETYDYGHDGWCVGLPEFMGDYTYPGYPFEGWELQVGTGRDQAFWPGGYAAGGTGTGLTGANTGYSNVGGRATGTWTGTATGLAMRQETRVDTLASWVVVTTYFWNTSAGPVSNVYYMRSTDPDNDVTWPGGSFFTNNMVNFQNDADHRVEVTGTGGSTTLPTLGLGTKDCRAVALVYDFWPLTVTQDISALWNQTYTPASYAVGVNDPGDIGIALVYNLGTIAPGDSAVISYAYIFNGVNGIDSAFPEPGLVVNGVYAPPIGPAPSPTFDTFDMCSVPGMTILPVDIINAEDKCWTWSDWTWSPSTGLSATTGTHVLINSTILPPMITYTITGTDSASNMYSCNHRVMYLTVKTCNIATSNRPCWGDTLKLDFMGDTTASTYYWRGPGGYTSTIRNPYIYPATWADTGDYVCIKFKGIGSDTDTINVQINPKPIISIITNAPICHATGVPDILTLSATPGGATDTFRWTGPTGFTSTLQSPTRPFTVADKGMYEVKITNQYGCKDTASVYATIFGFPPTVTGRLEYCQYIGPLDTLAVTHTTPTGVAVWYTVPTGGVGVPGPLFPNLNVAGTYNFYISTLDSGCESPRTPFTVTVHPKPAPPVPTWDRYCQFWPSHIVSAATSTVGGYLTWYGPYDTSILITGIPYPQTDTAKIDSYFVTETTVHGCVSNMALDTIHIIPKPEPPVTSDTSYCQFTDATPLNVQILDSTVGGYLLWYIGGIRIDSTPVPKTNNPDYPVGITWHVTQSVRGCTSDSATVKVTTVYKPEFEIAASQPWVCQFDSITLKYKGPALTAPDYLWTLPEGANFTFMSFATSDSVRIRFDSTQANNYIFLHVTNNNGKCFGDDTIRIKVVPQPIAIPASRTDVCMGDTVSLALSSHSLSADKYKWTIDYKPFATSNAVNIIAHNSNSGGPFLVSWIDSGRHYIGVTAWTEEGCVSEEMYDTIAVHTVPDATFNIVTRPGQLCLEDSVYFIATATDYNYAYEWAPAHFFNNLNTREIWGRVEQMTSIVTLKVTDPYGCVATTDMTIVPKSCCNVTFPSAFTPNGDGKNDVFRPIRDYANNSGFQRFHAFRIANRWGQTIFDAGNNTTSWDGTYNGVPQDMGVYYYFVKYECNGQMVEQTGDVTLVR